MADQLIGVEEVARMTGLAVKTIYNGAAGTNDLARVPDVGRRRLYSRKQVQAWIDRRARRAESSGQAVARLLSFTRKRA